MMQGTFHQSVRRGKAILSEESFLQRPGIDPNTDGHPSFPGSLSHPGNALPTADIAGVEAQPIHSLIDGFQSETIVEMDVGHEGDVNPLFNFPQFLRRFPVWNGNPYDFAPRILQKKNLGDGC
jgi:hypothetical protein